MRRFSLSILVLAAAAARGQAPAPAPEPRADATFVSQSVPSTAHTEQIVRISVEMKNTGATAWDSSVLLVIPRKGHGFIEGPVSLAEGESVEPGATKKFVFSLIAPKSPGVYPFEAQLKTGRRFIGEHSPQVMIKVEASRTGNGAKFLSQEIPPRMAAGAWYPVRITMKNTGTTTWTARGGYALHFGGWSEIMHQEPSRVFLDPGDSIAPGMTKTFSFLFEAPDNGRLHWRMVQAEKEYFGESTKIVQVKRPAHFGNLDAADCRVIAGWAADIGDYREHPRVALFADGTQFALVTASQFRQDLAAAHKGHGDNAFEIATPSFLLDGKTHSIGAFVVPSNRRELQSSPKSLTCTRDRKAP